MKNTNDILCIIPARGGSKGIPGKNMRLLGGQSLIAHSIKHAKIAKIPCTNIVVSSDSEEILAEAVLCGASICKRPDNISGDKSTTEECLIHTLQTYETTFNKKYKHILLLQATSPIRIEGTLDNFIKFHINGGYDSSLTATKFYNFFWKHLNNKEKEWESTYSPCDRPMRQDIAFEDFRFFDNGNAYLTKTSTLLENNSRLAGRVGVFPITDLEALQIDTPSDLFLLETVFDGTINGLTKIHEL